MKRLTSALLHVTRAAIPAPKLVLPPRRWLLLPIEIKAREFDGAALLAFEAARRGWGTIMGDLKTLRHADGLPKGLFISRWIKPGTVEKLSALKAKGMKISAWCDEGLVYRDASEYGRQKVAPQAFDTIEAFFAWGNYQANDMINVLGSPQDRIKVTGNPRFDLHRPERRPLLAGRVKSIVERYGNPILVNTKFSRFNGYYSEVDTLQRMRSRGQVGTPQHEAEYRDLITFHRKGFMAFVELVRRLSQQFPKRSVIVRPHPSERADTWLDIAAQLPNVRVSGEGNVAEWLLAADVVIHNNCTTGIECFLLGKTPISYRPVRDPRFDMLLPSVVSAEASNIDDVIAMVGGVLENKIALTPTDRGSEEFARRYIANMDGTPACERIMDVLDNLDVPEQQLEREKDTWVDALMARRNEEAKIRLIARANGERAGQRRKALDSRGELDASELSDFLSAAMDTLGGGRPVRAAKLRDDMLCVYTE